VEQDTKPPRPCTRIRVDEGGQGIGLHRMGAPQRGFVGHPMHMMQCMQTFMQEDHGQLRITQGGIELNATALEISLPEKTKALGCLDRQTAHRPGLLAHQNTARRDDFGTQMGAAGPQQRPAQGGITTHPLRQATRERMGQMFFGTFVKEDRLRIVHQSNQRMQEGSAPGLRPQTFSNEDALSAKINASMPSQDGHLVGRAFTNRDAIRPEFKGRREGLVTQISDGHGPDIMGLPGSPWCGPASLSAPVCLAA
jgi:hypothetical protein